MRRLLAAVLLVWVLLSAVPAGAHSPACRTAYPWIRYRVTVITVIPEPIFRAWFYNASTGATHSHNCFGWQL